MAKSPRKVNKSKHISHQNQKPMIGGKNLKSLPQINKERRFSIVDSSSSDSESLAYPNNQNGLQNNSSAILSGSESESSLTAVSEQDDVEASRKGSVFFASDNDESADEEVGLGNIYNIMNQTRYYSDSNKDENDDDEDDDDDDNEEDDNYSSSDDSDIDFVQLQAERKAKSIKAVRAMKSMKKNTGQQGKKKHQSHKKEYQQGKTASKSYKNRRSSSLSHPKFGRRKSEVALPEDINFTFDFDDFNKNGNSAIDDDEDEVDDDDEEEEDEGEEDDEKNDSMAESKVDKSSEEDIGEEIQLPNDELNGNASNNKDVNFEFDFDNPLVQVPKFKEDEFNSDEDYEIDDNELLATLQADNDLEEFNDTINKENDQSLIENSTNEHNRNNSVGSLNDDDENDPFLKEEEKFLVNEFENNGFDDDNNELEIDYSNGDRSLIDSFNNMNSNSNKQVVQYASDESNESEDEEEEEEDEYVDIMDFSAPFFDKLDQDDYNQTKAISANKNGKIHNKKNNHKLNGNSDEEDDSYLWNYFFSSDNNSNGEDDGYEDEDEEFDNHEYEIFNDDNGVKPNNQKRRNSRRKSIIPNNAIESDEDYYSGESTDVDESLPLSTNKTKFGSKMAKEVLSSKTADYRPPVLGTWVALDSKPFGIIDGLSTRTLSNISNTNNRNLEPKQKNRKSIAHNNTDDSALGLDELLNISELDNDDENDVRIWRDFNNQKKQVPLGAFRNKSILHNSMIHPDSLPMNYNHTSKTNNDFNNRRYSLTNKRKNSSDNKLTSNGITKKSSRKPSNSHNRSNSHHSTSNNNESDHSSSKQRRRRASVAEALQEGYRSTKAGVFSENALADVEEVFGDDNDLMALIKGL